MCLLRLGACEMVLDEMREPSLGWVPWSGMRVETGVLLTLVGVGNGKACCTSSVLVRGVERVVPDIDEV